MKRIIALLTVLMLFTALPATAEKRTDRPDLFRAKVEFTERKEEDNRYYISKEYLITANEAVNAILRKQTDDFDAALRPQMQPCPRKNAKRNSRLDIETTYAFTGDSWLSTMIIARHTFNRVQQDAPFVTGVYDLETGRQIQLTDLFPEQSPAWALLADRTKEKLSSMFPGDPRDPEAIARLTEGDAIRSAAFTLSAMELTLHFSARLVYPERTGLMHVRFFYDELWPMMTEEARIQTDNTDWRMVALTFDDGPNYDYTPSTLTQLRRAGVRATFFTVGRVCGENPEILMRTYDQNHIIACHSFTHRNGHSLDRETLISEVQQHTDLLNSIIGEPAALFRAPGGTYPPWIEAGTGMPIIQWSVDTYDYTGKEAKRIFYSIRNNVQDGDIILMHDTRPNTHKAVPIFTEWLWDNGYMMVTVDELARRNGVAMQADNVYYRALDGMYDVRTDSNLN
ncbi:MAG: hypothetical protein E7320_12970 [Clostridiales bacterium]|nr:hypothetical protein [Clostridiales bacterium]